MLHDTHAHPRTKAYLAGTAIVMMMFAEDGLMMIIAFAVLVFALAIDTHRGGY